MSGPALRIAAPAWLRDPYALAFGAVFVLALDFWAWGVKEPLVMGLPLWAWYFVLLSALQTTLMPAPAAAHEDESGINLVEYWDIIVDNRWLVAAVIAISVALGGTYAFLARPIYEANLLVQVEDNMGNTKDLIGQAAGRPVDALVFNEARPPAEVAARYAAGPNSLPSTPTAPTVSVARDGGNVRVSFTGTLQSADNVRGPWTDVPGATSPLSVTASAPGRYFRARQ